MMALLVSEERLRAILDAFYDTACEDGAAEATGALRPPLSERIKQTTVDAAVELCKIGT